MPIELPEQTIVDASALVLADYNPRLMPTAMMESLKDGLRKFGFVQPIVARAEDGLVIGGHQRLTAYHQICAEDGVPLGGVPVVLLSGLNDTETKALNLSLNKIGGEWDFEKLSTVLLDLTTVGDNALDLALTGFTSSEAEDIIGLMTLPSTKETSDADSQAAIDAAISRVQRRFQFQLETAEDMELCSRVLELFGMTGNKNASEAFLNLCKANESKAPDVVPEH